MVRALLAGTKTQTRRLAKRDVAPYGERGDRLWVKEAFAAVDRNGRDFQGRLAEAEEYVFRADRPDAHLRWRSPLHMPRCASRILVQITDVRSEPLQSISENDALAEGVDSIAAYEKQWDVLNAPHAPWSENPRVWVVTFAREESRRG